MVDNAVSVCDFQIQRAEQVETVTANAVQIFTHAGSTNFSHAYLPAKSTEGNAFTFKSAKRFID